MARSLRRIWPRTQFRLTNSTCVPYSFVPTPMKSCIPECRLKLRASLSTQGTGFESDALNFSLHSGMQDFIGVGTNEYGTHVEFVNRNCVLGQILRRLRAIWSVGNAIRFVGPEVAEGLRQYRDVAESLHPISSIPSGHDKAQWE